MLILIYVSICYAVFKIFRIPVNQWSPRDRGAGRDRRHQPDPADHELQSSILDRPAAHRGPPG
jgi:hypothetical protein